MTEIVAAILWRRLDTEGHDACALQRVASNATTAGERAARASMARSALSL